MNPNPLFPTTDTLGINTDLYELTMAAAYFDNGRSQDLATFELFTRQLPERRNFLLVAGLEQALHYALNVGFTEETVEFLRGLEAFQNVSDAFFEYLKGFRFTGDIWAMPEGTVFFEKEPIVQVRAPIIESQLLETYLINSLNYQSMVASKAARMCLGARGRSVVDFGSRRAHGPQTAVLAARACFLGGCSGTSNVLAGYEMGIPVFGTMAHSFVQSFDSEEQAFNAFLRVFPDHTTILIDTYDSLEGIAKTLELKGSFDGIRLDSGDLAGLAQKAREMLDRAGRKETRIFVSSSLNEEKILAYSLKGLPIDGYGVGTEMVVSSDAPSCDLVYKLVELTRDGIRLPKFKASEEKRTLPLRKQVYRKSDEGAFAGDWICCADEEGPAGSESLLKKYVEGGKLIEPIESLDAVRTRAQRQIEQLPPTCKHLHSIEWYPVRVSRLLETTQAELQAKYTR
ncbi:MAG: nicotinate phosphoribosyltransferase [Acidobacteriota bacterium]|nr:MAG: nicotinate phosphoribosyltransferase [Acidobacteriota bacterium]